MTTAGEFAGLGAERPRSATIFRGVMLRTALLVTAVFAALASGTGAAVCEDLGCLNLNTPGQATGGGQVAGELAELAILRGTSAGGRANFGFNAQFGSGDPAPSGHLTFIDHGLKKTVKTTSIESFLVAGSMAMFSGRATVDRTPGVAFSVEVEDLGEPGNADTFRITLSDGYMAGGVLLHGNIQVREGEPPPDDGDRPAILAGAAKVNITPFTLTDELMACRFDPSCPYFNIVSLSNAQASNPDGLPGGLFASIGAEMAGPAASAQWVGPAGAWGEQFVDANTNGRYDAGEAFAEDPANSSAVVGAGHTSTLGDPASSTGKWDGIYIAGYGNDRVALGAFDPLWARVLFLRDSRTGTSVAWVSLDLLGYFSDFVGRIRERLRDDLDVDEIILTHTHDHEAPDTHVGIWGEELFRDGTYPRYEIYIEAKIAQAIEQAAGAVEPARFRFGTIRPGETFVTPNGNVEDLEGMMSRNSCRTPWFFDDELRVMQVATANMGRTIATVLNWSAHVESMDGRNKYLSSDFPTTARGMLEQGIGGVALYTPGPQGASEIIGDSCTRRWHRDTFDGERFPVDSGGDPLAFQDPYNNTDARDRTYAIGRVVGAAALAALQDEAFDPADAPLEFHGPRLLCFPVNNDALAALAVAGVIDKPLANAECPTQAGDPPDRAKTSLYAFRIGSGSFINAPGEMQPELYYGISNINRATFDASAGGYDYVSANPDALECSGRSHHGPVQPGAHNDRPFEPAIRDAQKARFGARVNFLIGYTPDLLGYIVPGYDFYWLGGPGGFGLPVDQIDDPCRDIPPDLAFPAAPYRSHYQETNSAGSMLGPAVTCELVRLLGDPLGEAASDPLAEGPRRACFEWDVANATGRQPDRVFIEPGCPVPSPDACLIRHY